MKLKTKTWLKPLCEPLYDLVQFSTKNMSFYNTIVPSPITTFLLRLIALISRLSFAILEIFLDLNFRLSNLSPCNIALDDKTLMHFWAPTKTKPNRPNVVLIHGYGGTSRYQFYWQVRQLSHQVNLFVPDLLFFGGSYTGWPDRSDVFQAKCVKEGMKRLGVERFSVAGISYGGYVAYRMGEMYPKEVEKVVITSSGLCYSEEQKIEHLKKLGRSPMDLLVPQKPQDLRLLVNLCVYKFDPLKWIPDLALEEAITVLHKDHMKEKREIIEYLMNKEAADSNLGVISQETLLIWGDKDNVFPIIQAYQLQRHLEPRAKVAVIKDTGHAVNFDAPIAMSNLILSFVEN